MENYFKIIINKYDNKIYEFSNHEKIILKFKIFILNTIKLVKKIIYKILNIKKFVY